MTTPTYGLTPEGFVKKPLEVIKSQFETGLQAEFGNVNTDPESVFGQLIGGGSKAVEDLWETVEAVYYSQYPNSAEGTALDNVALILGITRLPATKTRVVAVISGVEGTVIPAGTLATQPGGAYTFVGVQDTLITRASAQSAIISIGTYTAGQTYTISIDGVPYSEVAGPNPGDNVTLIQNLVNKIGTNLTSTNTYYAVVNQSGVSLKVQSFDSEFPFNVTSTANMTISGVTSPMIFEASQTGPIAVPINTLTQPITSILGWSGITNLKAGATGTNQETDAELRLRRAKAFILGGFATVEAIRSHLLQEVSGVVSVEIIENRTMTQTPLIFSMSSNFSVGDKIDVIIDGIAIGQVSFAGNQQATMNSIAAMIATVDGVQSAIVGPNPYRSITVSFKQGYQLTDNNLIIERVSGFVNFSKSGGRPPKSFETIVEGGTDPAVAANIWKTKPAGIETFGNTRVIITDSMGNEQAIFFTRAEVVNIWVDVVAVRNLEEELAGGSIDGAIEYIKENIMTYAATLKIGMDVINQRVMCKVIDVSGIGSAIVKLAARTDNVTPGPGEYVLTNITISDTQIASFNTAHIAVSIT